MDQVLHEAWVKNTGGLAMAEEEIRLSEKERQLLLRVLQQVQLATPGGIIRSDLDALIRTLSGVNKFVVVKTAN
jgi:hypothetical protein